MDAIKLIVLFVLGLALPAALFGNWPWFLVWTSIALVVVLAELINYLIYKKTISKEFWLWKEEHPKVKWIALGGYVLFFGYLALHLWLHW